MVGRLLFAAEARTTSQRRLVCTIRLWRGPKEDTGVWALRAAEGSLLWLFPGPRGGAGRGGVQPRELGPNGGGPAVVVDCRPRAALLPWPERGP